MVSQTTTKRIKAVRPNRFRRMIEQTEHDITAEPDPISIYEALLSISKGYVQLNKIIEPPI